MYGTSENGPGGLIVLLSTLAYPMSFSITNALDSGAGSLRQAIEDANAASGPDVIAFEGLDGQTISVKSAPLEILGELAVTGPGVDKLLLRGEDAEIDVIQIKGSGFSVRIASMAIEGGEDGVQISPGSNGLSVELAGVRVGRQLSDDAISVSGSLNKLRIVDSVLVGSEDNISLDGTRNALSVVGSSVVSARQDGLEVAGDNNAVLIENSTFGENGRVGSPNDGIDIDGSTNRLDLKEATLSGNGEDGLDVEGPNNRVSIESATIAFNGRDGLKVQDQTNTSSVAIHNTIVGQNNGPDVDGPIKSLGHNLIGDGTGSSGFGASGHQVGRAGGLIDAQLSGLSNAGGTTAVHVPEPGSPAINGGDPDIASAPEFDQRRSGFPRVLGGRIDIGAVETAPR